MSDLPSPSQEATLAEPTKTSSLKSKRTFWQWVWRIIIVLLGALIGFILALIVGLTSGLIEFNC